MVIAPADLQISLILPCYNEEQNIKNVISDAKNYLKTFASFEIIAVNDASTDNTLKTLQTLQSVVPALKIIDLEKNQGLSGALYKGMQEASFENIITFDADFQYRAESINNLLEKYDKQNIVCGYRLNRADNIIKKISSKIANTIGDLITGDKVKDSGCCFRLFPKSLVDKILFFNGFHRFFPSLAKAQNFEVLEVGIPHFPREQGKSNFNISNRIFKSLSDAVYVRKYLKANLK